MKDQQGNKLTTKEFMAKWKEGIQAITPLQQARVNLIGSTFVIVGVLIGFYATIRTKLWWLLVVLIGTFFLTTMGLLGNLQKYFALKKINEMIRRGTNDGTRFCDN